MKRKKKFRRSEDFIAGRDGVYRGTKDPNPYFLNKVIKILKAVGFAVVIYAAGNLSYSH